MPLETQNTVRHDSPARQAGAPAEEGDHVAMQPIELFRDCYQIHEEKTLHRLCELAEVRRLKKGEIFLYFGEVQTHIALQTNGILRGYYTDVDGTDHTDCFSFRCGNAAMPPCGLTEPSSINLMALTPCELVTLPLSETLELIRQSPELFQVYSKLLTEALRLHNGIKNALCNYTAKQKYEWFLQEYPGLIFDVNNRYIASFLHMTPETLSRLRTATRKRIEG